MSESSCASRPPSPGALLGSTSDKGSKSRTISVIRPADGAKLLSRNKGTMSKAKEKSFSERKAVLATSSFICRSSVSELSSIALAKRVKPLTFLYDFGLFRSIIEIISRFPDM
eukprot:CAMPEP_0198241588 /NCGR_PEP_ID=MMETSP1446-20131203/6374_1 /TAXON_ID=1461542 ORGANISM="Unidentified sp, Strain CCMP2111" /NCGR_SAMPLE_ID=MMETSP1446 /ASSEMBLY_ACC=CAM_ASM_001112 /LENGTH=112 /DNA_ID=CAMNT_0043924447 /DNA_START=295 /DNA_END=633 /DNA_ORIENTATION=-